MEKPLADSHGPCLETIGVTPTKRHGTEFAGIVWVLGMFSSPPSISTGGARRFQSLQVLARCKTIELQKLTHYFVVTSGWLLGRGDRAALVWSPLKGKVQIQDVGLSGFDIESFDDHGVRICEAVRQAAKVQIGMPGREAELITTLRVSDVVREVGAAAFVGNRRNGGRLYRPALRVKNPAADQCSALHVEHEGRLFVWLNEEIYKRSKGPELLRIRNRQNHLGLRQPVNGKFPVSISNCAERAEVRISPSPERRQTSLDFHANRVSSVRRQDATGRDALLFDRDLDRLVERLFSVHPLSLTKSNGGGHKVDPPAHGNVTKTKSTCGVRTALEEFRQCRCRGPGSGPLVGRTRNRTRPVQ